MQFILSGSKRFRKNGGPHLKGSRRPRKKVAINRPLLLRRPKVVFFGAQVEENRFFFIFSAPPRYGVWRRNNFFDPLKKRFRPPINFSAPPKKKSAAFFFRRPKPKIGFFGGRLRSNIFRRLSGKTSAFFFFFSAPPRHGVRRPNNFFDSPKIFCVGIYFFFGAPKNRRFSAPKTKNQLFRRA